MEKLQNNGFIVMNEDGEFFAGLMYGKILFISDINDAKPLYDLHKFEMMKFWIGNQNLIYEYL